MKIIMYDDTRLGILTDAGLVDTDDLSLGLRAAPTRGCRSLVPNCRRRCRVPERSNAWAATTESLGRGNSHQ